MKIYEIKEVICEVGKMSESKEIKKLGREGWALVNVVPMLQSGTSPYIAIFQREIENN